MIHNEYHCNTTHFSLEAVVHHSDNADETASQPIPIQARGEGDRNDRCLNHGREGLDSGL